MYTCIVILASEAFLLIKPAYATDTVHYETIQTISYMCNTVEKIASPYHKATLVITMHIKIIL